MKIDQIRSFVISQRNQQGGGPRTLLLADELESLPSWSNLAKLIHSLH